MNVSSDFQSIYPSGFLKAGVGDLLKQASNAWAETKKAEAFLLEAQKMAPKALPVYFSLYKFYFYKGELEQAENTVRKALDTSAELGNFDNDWAIQTRVSAPWSQHDSPAHFYLFSLKALAFIRLRRGDPETCQAILAKLTQLDPEDTIGSGVIRSIANSIHH